MPLNTSYAEQLCFDVPAAVGSQLDTAREMYNNVHGSSWKTNKVWVYNLVRQRVLEELRKERSREVRQENEKTAEMLKTQIEGAFQ